MWPPTLTCDICKLYNSFSQEFFFLLFLVIKNVMNLFFMSGIWITSLVTSYCKVWLIIGPYKGRLLFIFRKCMVTFVSLVKFTFVVCNVDEQVGH